MTVKYLNKKANLALRYFLKRLSGNKYPDHLALEVTKRCNAKCRFCDYYKENVPELSIDYPGLVKKIKPIIVSITGGEPLIRKDLEKIISDIKNTDPTAYIMMVTNGSLMTYERALSLHKAGLCALNFSMDYLGAKHDENRGIPGLFNKIVSIIPQIKTIGFDMVSFNTVIMNDNLDQIIPLVELAEKLGININFSSYSNLKNNRTDLLVEQENLDRLKSLIEDLIDHKRRSKTIKTSNYYLRNVLKYFIGHKIDGCLAGIKWILVTPDAKIKRCSEKEPEADVTSYNDKTFNKTTCNLCWFSCRGEAQCPLTIERIRDYI